MAERGKVRRVKYYPADFVAGIVGRYSAADVGVYLLVCSLVLHRDGPISHDAAELARVFKGTPAAGVRRSLDRLIDAGDVLCTEDDELDISERAFEVVWETYRPAIPKWMRDRIFDSAGGRCTYCGCEVVEDGNISDQSFHIDHVVPLSLGGSNDFTNLVASCRACNLSKRATPVEEWEQ